MLNRVLETNPDQRQLYHNVQKKNALMHHLIQMTLKNVRLRCAIYILIFYIYYFQRMDLHLQDGLQIIGFGPISKSSYRSVVCNTSCTQLVIPNVIKLPEPTDPMVI